MWLRLAVFLFDELDVDFPHLEYHGIKNNGKVLSLINEIKKKDLLGSMAMFN